MHTDFFYWKNSKNEEKKEKSSTLPNNPTTQRQFGPKPLLHL